MKIKWSTTNWRVGFREIDILDVGKRCITRCYTEDNLRIMKRFMLFEKKRKNDTKSYIERWYYHIFISEILYCCMVGPGIKQHWEDKDGDKNTKKCNSGFRKPILYSNAGLLPFHSYWSYITLYITTSGLLPRIRVSALPLKQTRCLPCMRQPEFNVLKNPIIRDLWEHRPRNKPWTSLGVV